jgi:type IV pilus assembly protein PilV
MSCKRNGFSLIEVMVSLVILVIGLIGIFNLHIISKQGSFESFQQTQASYYANDIINRMRLNSSQLLSYGGAFEAIPPSTVEPSPACRAGALCTPAEMTAWDIYEWQAAFSGLAEIVDSKPVGGLDTPSACISIIGNTVTVVIDWRGIRETKIANPIVCAKDKENRRQFSIQTVII